MTEEVIPKVYFYRRIVQSKLFIDENFAENIDAGDISDEACFSKFYFMRMFKRVYGKTPHQYLTFVRIAQAKALLKEGVSVTQVCFAVGFNSVSSFISLFKRYVSSTPSEYQSSQLLLKAEMSQMPTRFIPSCFGDKISSLKKSNIQEA